MPFGDYANVADAIFTGGIFGAAAAADTGGSQTTGPKGGIVLTLPPIPYNPATGGAGGAAGAAGQASGAAYGAGIIEWVLVLVAVITLVVTFEADSKIGGGLLIILVLLMLYSAHKRGVV